MRLATWIKLAGMVIIAVIVVQVGKGIADRMTSGCDPAGADVAHAETTDCPSYVSQAAGDSAWAARQQRDMTGPLTIGRYITSRSATPIQVESGWNKPDGISDRIVDLLRRSPRFPDLGNGKPTVAGDVETEVAMVMREGGATSGVVAINHPRMCSGPVSCRVAITAILPKGSVL